MFYRKKKEEQVNSAVPSNCDDILTSLLASLGLALAARVQVKFTFMVETYLVFLTFGKMLESRNAGYRIG